ncbi:hypothetical protein GIW05_00200 [Pseudomonas syringae]|uniref:hypothetical protein n=1 Tax=Pseudomonas syringae TaxID=317 RepID=UPI001F361CA0|nr:hypothetical protein [Pseudomonas syringae]MCF5381942.1 hypothetical protein [Pseudomonas syringae]MCF5423804.1 hypothetical protein [Pseudomonas syringae]MCF5454995.1 hypothetical protein [Pseudomonas syringae]MCF5459567.1 hypothetical protein [Pseudomonas syringae]
MGRLIAGLALLATSGFAVAEGIPQSIPQQQMDAIREYHTKQIMGSSQSLTNLQPDVVLYRKMFERRENEVDQPKFPTPDPVPLAQVFKAHDITLGQLVNVAAAASGYDVAFHPQVNQRQIVKINSRPNSLTDMAEYLTRVTDAQFAVYPDSRLLIALPKGTGK